MLLKTKNNPLFEWRPEHEYAFEELQKCFGYAHVLALYDRNADHEVHMDASSVGLAGILMQANYDGIMHPVFYYSRHTTDSLFAWQEIPSFYRLSCSGHNKTVKTTHTTNRQICWLRLQEFEFELVSHQAEPGSGASRNYNGIANRQWKEVAAKCTQRVQTAVDSRLIRKEGDDLKWGVPRGVRWRIVKLPLFAIEKTILTIPNDF